VRTFHKGEKRKNKLIAARAGRGLLRNLKTELGKGHSRPSIKGQAVWEKWTGRKEVVVEFPREGGHLCLGEESGIPLGVFEEGANTDSPGTGVTRGRDWGAVTQGKKGETTIFGEIRRLLGGRARVGDS